VPSSPKFRRLKHRNHSQRQPHRQARKLPPNFATSKKFSQSATALSSPKTRQCHGSHRTQLEQRDMTQRLRHRASSGSTTEDGFQTAGCPATSLNEAEVRHDRLRGFPVPVTFEWRVGVTPATFQWTRLVVANPEDFHRNATRHIQGGGLDVGVPQTFHGNVGEPWSRLCVEGGGHAQRCGAALVLAAFRKPNAVHSCASLFTSFSYRAVQVSRTHRDIVNIRFSLTGVVQTKYVIRGFACELDPCTRGTLLDPQCVWWSCAWARSCGFSWTLA